MSNPVLRVENLGKKYLLRHQQRERYTALRDVIAQRTRRLARAANPFSKPASSRSQRAYEEFWALKDVSFEVQQGDRVGIIGRNGAGKSTLLKILSRITEPTTGSIRIKGRVASLLEVGTGFHPELTGRENIFLNGAILGMSQAEIRRKFDEIVAFSEVEKFLDTPVKRYSSGMYVRLAFAVAAHLEPEILVVDEVLAVGDAAFQNKCLGKMEDVATNEGRTVLFVSHNLTAVQRLCQKGIYLNSGTVQASGNIATILAVYQKNFSDHANDITQTINVNDGEARFVRWQIKSQETNLEHTCYSRDFCQLAFTLCSKRKVSHAIIGFALWTLEGELVLAGSSSDNNGSQIDFDQGIYETLITVRLPLRAGTYQLDISLNSPGSGQIDRWSAEPKLTILPKSNTSLPEAWHGLVNEEVKFEFSHETITTRRSN